MRQEKNEPDRRRLPERRTALLSQTVLIANIILLIVLVGLLAFLTVTVFRWPFWLIAAAGLLCVGVILLLAVMVGKVQERYKQLIQSELFESRRYTQEIQLQKRQEQLNALQSQINPHFLYNVLDTIRGMAIEEGNIHVADIIATLSAMFKYSMDYASSLVTISNEIAHLEWYLKIQDMRFPERFHFEQVQECDFKDLQAITLPKLTLQPIVENAINHGFRNKSEGAIIRIRYIRTQVNFQIIVSDNGQGMEDDRVLALNQSFHLSGEAADNLWKSTSGIALANIDSRVKIYCGESYGLHIASTEGIGTDVTLLLPIGEREL